MISFIVAAKCQTLHLITKCHLCSFCSVATNKILLMCKYISFFIDFKVVPDGWAAKYFETKKKIKLK